MNDKNFNILKEEMFNSYLLIRDKYLYNNIPIPISKIDKKIIISFYFLVNEDSYIGIDKNIEIKDIFFLKNMLLKFKNSFYSGKRIYLMGTKYVNPGLTLLAFTNYVKRKCPYEFEKIININNKININSNFFFWKESSLFISKDKYNSFLILNSHTIFQFEDIYLKLANALNNDFVKLFKKDTIDFFQKKEPCIILNQEPLTLELKFYGINNHELRKKHIKKYLLVSFKSYLLDDVVLKKDKENFEKNFYIDWESLIK